MPKATFEEGTEIVLDSETVAVATGFTDHATAGSDVFRNGPRVSLGLRVTNTARKAWDKEVEYALNQMVTEGGKTYLAIKAASLNKKPSSNPTWWQEVPTPNRICTLPVEYRPAVDLVNAGGTVEAKANGEVLALDSLEASAAKVYDIGYRAASVSP